MTWYVRSKLWYKSLDTTFDKKRERKLRTKITREIKYTRKCAANGKYRVRTTEINSILCPEMIKKCTLKYCRDSLHKKAKNKLEILQVVVICSLRTPNSINGTFAILAKLVIT